MNIDHCRVTLGPVFFFYFSARLKFSPLRGEFNLENSSKNRRFAANLTIKITLKVHH